jgi:hypothetical protein
VVLDFENAGLAEPEYELRCFPGPGMGPGVELLTATMRHYEGLTGRALSAERIMAWHVRQALGDVLWRSDAGLPLPDEPVAGRLGRRHRRATPRTQHQHRVIHPGSRPRSPKRYPAGAHAADTRPE